jgi:linoleoyl-CoA desaturase
VADVRDRVAAYFRDRGISPHADARMAVRTIAMLAVLFVPYGFLLSGVPGPVALGLCALMGIGIAGLGFAPCHDALHGAYSSRRSVNRAIGYLFEVVGASGALWLITHNKIHHTYTNVHGVDLDLDSSALLRLSPHAAWRPVHRLQTWYAPLLYALASINWIFLKDFKDFARPRIGPFPNSLRTPWSFTRLILAKAFCYAWTIVVPILVLRPTVGEFLLGFFAMHATAGVLLGITFQLAHAVEHVDFPANPAEGRLEDAWMVHQMRTTSDFATDNRLLTWYVGGLNHQVEHHLFPTVCSVHYPDIRPIVRECAERHGVPYHDRPSLSAAIGAHWELLRRHGRRPALVAAPTGALPGA